tara:strand:+ start:816 stop:4385 length:3570 start_codon:yes stop_codon:yes gene_type:complete
MPRIEANLDAGLNTQDDPKRVGFNGFVQLQNIRHVNGKIIKRFGTGAQSSNISGNAASNPSCIINNAGIFVHRKLTGARIDNTSSNNITFTASNGRMNLASTTGLTIPGQTADLRNIFKAGDVITISTSEENTPTNINKALTIASVDSATQITFTTTLEDDTLNNSTDCVITFVFDRNDDGNTPNNLQITDANSFDGRALIVTYADGANMEIGMLNANDYGDLETITTIANASDMHIRMKAYTDGVRFACGLDNSPLLFKYINRQHFNGLLKNVYNSNAHTMYPTWFMDTAVPVVEANTYTLSTFKADDVGGTADSIRFMNGSLNLKDNTYDYKFIPIYDGNQQGLLSEPVAQASTGTISTIHDKENNRSVVDASKSCALATITIDMTKLNPRTSGINVYRSTNGGTYYKIKTIYMGDNDPNQHNIADIYNETDRVWFSGSNTLSSSTLNGKIVVHDSFTKSIVNGTGNNNFQSTGYKSFETSSISDTIGTGTYSRVEYGDNRTCKFNFISEETENIVGGDDSYSGGSPNGGWYIGGAEKALTVNGVVNTDGDLINDLSFNEEPGSGTDGDIHGNCAGYNLNGPFGNSASGHMDFFISNPGDILNDAGACFDISDESSSLTNGTYIISGWIRAVGLNHRDSRWNFYVTTNKDQEENADSGGSGLQSIAVGRGTENANMPWTYFQYQIDIPSGSDLFGVVFINTPDGLTSSASDSGAKMSVQVWGLRLTETVSGYDLNQRLRGFMGNNVMVSSSINNEQFPPGILKGNRIQEDSTVSYPVDVDDDRSYISDNYGPFIKCVDNVPGVISADDHKDNFMFGSSNYQFYFDGSDNTVQNMKLDFFDPGLPDGARHPYETSTSSDVKFKYATMLNGRQFVANVKITGEEETEEYPNFVMYSEPNSPDIIPTSNFIQLQDLQGGEIVGIETLMSDIVVFMTKGIFRINVPSADPTNWSLVEAHPNIGCINDKGITKAPNGIFFLSNEDVIFLDSGFQATPITYPIRDDYQSTVASSSSIMKTHYDAKYNKLYITKSVSTNTEFYIYDIFRQVWYTEKHAGVEYDEFSFDNNNNTLLIESATQSNIRKAVDTSEYRDKGSVAIEMIAQTGEQELTSYDQNAYIRRINTNTNKGSGSGTALDLQVVSGSTFTENNFLNGVQSTRTSQRGKSVQVKISDDSSAENEVKEISRLEVEYE